ncbi:DNA topoisomerase I [Candidatus Woesearchaeota archaeon]|nr:DNA topoisomerase I [Candidatus Woesearchaeota archaeon]
MPKKEVKKKSAAAGKASKAAKASSGAAEVELIISEKPNAAKRIAESLADSKPIKKAEKGVPYYEITHNKKDITVVSAVGHLYTVAEKKKSFTYPSFDLEWKPTCEVSKDAAFSKKYLDVIKKLSKTAKTFTVACDYDVEGEVIGLNCMKYACGQKDAHRMKFSTLTKEDLVEAYENAENTINWGLANAGETRHFLDWMYGINLSRALTLAIKSTGAFKILSSGRVQGPALKILYDKEKEIEAFKPTPYWQIILGIEKNHIKIEALHEKEKFQDHAEAKARFERSLWKPAHVKEVEKNERNISPPTPFDLGSLQTEAYKLFGIKPRDTLSTAQNLYTSGAISYPRTSSQKLPAKLGYQKILNGLAKSNEEYAKKASYLLKLPKLIPNEGKKDDPAHPAIYPTGLKPSKLSAYEAKIYDLIVKRFFATFGTPAVRESITLKIDVGGEIFTATGMRTKEKNWFDLYEPYAKFKEEEWPAFAQGEALKIFRLDMVEKQTQPPKRYTPASIINELEKRGLGTKATRAEIVESLYQRKYAFDDSIKVTLIGKQIVETLQKYCPDILDETLTKTFEDDMEKIMSHEKKEEEILSEARKVLTKILKDFKSKEKIIGEELKEANKETMDKESFIAKCPKCHEGNLRMMFSKKNRARFIACDRYPDCETTYNIPQSGGVKATDKTCPVCHHPVILMIYKRKRPQEICINKECPTKKEDTIEVKTHANEKGQAIVDARKCPKCGQDLILRSSIYGRFIGCSAYPKCRFTESLKKKEEKKEDKPVEPKAPAQTGSD